MLLKLRLGQHFELIVQLFAHGFELFLLTNLLNVVKTDFLGLRIPHIVVLNFDFRRVNNAFVVFHDVLVILILVRRPNFVVETLAEVVKIRIPFNIGVFGEKEFLLLPSILQNIVQGLVIRKELGFQVLFLFKPLNKVIPVFEFILFVIILFLIVFGEHALHSDPGFPLSLPKRQFTELAGTHWVNEARLKGEVLLNANNHIVNIISRKTLILIYIGQVENEKEFFLFRDPGQKSQSYD